jgi:hypothetical protein
MAKRTNNNEQTTCPFGHCIASFGIVMRGGLFIIVCPFGHCIASFGIVIVWFVHYCLSIMNKPHNHDTE